MPKYLVTKHVQHDGKLHRKGATIDLSAADAKPLIEIGHLAAPEEKEKAAK